MFPIAWAVVQAENEANWKWFLGILAEDLDLGEGVGITIISDQQKVLIQPNAFIFTNLSIIHTRAWRMLLRNSFLWPNIEIAQGMCIRI